jgi:hypothetical protein
MARILLVVKDDLGTRLDRAVGLLVLKTGKRQTRTSLIVRAVEAEIERLEAEEASGKLAGGHPRRDPPASH